MAGRLLAYFLLFQRKLQSYPLIHLKRKKERKKKSMQRFGMNSIPFSIVFAREFSWEASSKPAWSESKSYLTKLKCRPRTHTKINRISGGTSSAVMEAAGSLKMTLTGLSSHRCIDAWHRCSRTVYPCTVRLAELKKIQFQTSVLISPSKTTKILLTSVFS